MYSGDLHFQNQPKHPLKLIEIMNVRLREPGDEAILSIPKESLAQSLKPVYQQIYNTYSYHFVPPAGFEARELDKMIKIACAPWFCTKS